MILNTAVLAYAFLIFFSLGVIAKILIDKTNWLEKSSLFEVPVDYYIIFGLFLLTVFLAVFSVFHKVRLLANLVVCGTLFVGVLIYRKKFKELVSFYYAKLRKSQLGIHFILFWPLIAILFLYTISPFQGYDTNLYHAQAVQWIQSYKTVPGLVWIHSRFAFNSHLFLPSAFFTMSFLNLEDSAGASIIFYPVNSLLYLVLFCRVVSNIINGIQKKETFRIVLYGVAFLTSFFSFGRSIQTPAPDIAVAILIFYLFFIYLDGLELEKSEKFGFSHVIFISTIFTLITFKISCVPLLIFMPFIVLRTKFSLKTSYWVLALGTIIVIPYLVRNVILSGYLVYPVYQIDLFNVDWKYLHELTVRESNVIKGWARINRSAIEVLSMPLTEWIPIWWKIQNRDINRVLLIVSLFSPAVFSLLVVCAFQKYKKYILPYSVLLLSLAFWFFSAPDPRFVWGLLSLNAALIFGLVADAFQRIVNIKIAVMGLTILMIYAIIDHQEHWTYMLKSDFLKETRYFPKQQEIHPTKELKIDNQVVYRVPENFENGEDRCYNAKIPCAPSKLPEIQLRGASIDAGFRYASKPTPK